MTTPGSSSSKTSSSENAAEEMIISGVITVKRHHFLKSHKPPHLSGSVTLPLDIGKAIFRCTPQLTKGFYAFENTPAGVEVKYGFTLTKSTVTRDAKPESSAISAASFRSFLEERKLREGDKVEFWTTDSLLSELKVMLNIKRGNVLVGSDGLTENERSQKKNQRLISYESHPILSNYKFVKVAEQTLLDGIVGNIATTKELDEFSGIMGAWLRESNMEFKYRLIGEKIHESLVELKPLYKGGLDAAIAHASFAVKEASNAKVSVLSEAAKSKAPSARASKATIDATDEAIRSAVGQIVFHVPPQQDEGAEGTSQQAEGSSFAGKETSNVNVSVLLEAAKSKVPSAKSKVLSAKSKAPSAGASKATIDATNEAIRRAVGQIVFHVPDVVPPQQDGGAEGTAQQAEVPQQDVIPPQQDEGAEGTSQQAEVPRKRKR